MGHNELDALILRTLIIDGEVFIRIHHPNNKYGLSFEIVDSASIDYTKRREFSYAGSIGTAIVLGVEIDRYYKPVRYYMRPGTTTVYQAGKEEIVSADKIIHIFKKEFPQQVRGIPPLNASLDALKNLEDYRIAELLAAKAASCVGLFYEPTGDGPRGDFQTNQESDLADDKGEFMQKVEPFTASVVPYGYSAKTMTPNHPNSGYDAFTKSILTQIATSLGVSYAKLLKDYSAVNYSSLREGTLDEAAYYAEQQSFLIEAWKEIEFSLFIEALAINTDVVKPSQVKDVMMNHTWICQKRGYFDPTKEVISTEREIKLGLKSPLMIMEENGLDPDEVMRSWKLYEDMCKNYGVKFDVSDEEKSSAADPNLNNESEQNDLLNHA